MYSKHIPAYLSSKFTSSWFAPNFGVWKVKVSGSMMQYIWGEQTEEQYIRSIFASPCVISWKDICCWCCLVSAKYCDKRCFTRKSKRRFPLSDWIVQRPSFSLSLFFLVFPLRLIEQTILCTFLPMFLWNHANCGAKMLFEMLGTTSNKNQQILLHLWWIGRARWVRDELNNLSFVQIVN